MSMSTTTTRIPQVGELWLVHYPYRTPGGYEKTRPGIIVGFGEGDEVYVRKITTKNKKGNRPFLHPKLKKQSFLTKEVLKMRDYNLIRFIGKTEIGVWRIW